VKVVETCFSARAYRWSVCRRLLSSSIKEWNKLVMQELTDNTRSRSLLLRGSCDTGLNVLLQRQCDSGIMRPSRLESECIRGESLRLMVHHPSCNTLPRDLTGFTVLCSVSDVTFCSRADLTGTNERIFSTASWQTGHPDFPVLNALRWLIEITCLGSNFGDINVHIASFSSILSIYFRV